MKDLVKETLTKIVEALARLDKERIRIYNFEFYWQAGPGASATVVTASGLPNGANVVGFSIGRPNNVGFAPTMAEYRGGKDFYVGTYNHWTGNLPNDGQPIQIFVFYNYAT